MKVEYTQNEPDKSVNGFEFIAYRWVKSKETLIINNLWEVITNNSEESFEDIYKLLKLYQRLTKVKSKADIVLRDNNIEINNRSTIFPNIVVTKKPIRNETGE